MSSVNQRASTSNGGGEDEGDETVIREIHPLTPPRPLLQLPPPPNRARRTDSWETGSNISGENFTTMSREFNALVLAGSTIAGNNSENEGGNAGNNLSRIGEDDDHEVPEETNPLAIVPDNSLPLNHGSSPPPRRINGSSSANGGFNEEITTLQMVKKEEVHSKISAWQTAKIAKVNNRFKREESNINGCESEHVQKAQAALKKVERKLEEKRAKAVEKMRNEVAKAHRKAEEKKASAEAKRGTKVAKILEIANLMKAIGRVPTKRSFF
ncbi:remorin 4.2-like [Macadamia integrifolia]|uniref:remorin 4.2-like n=1 Tax=Macadamia integrifolia TaxID=60698 RepID=UPI001C4F19F7|nr:remorin 4.2-like [Macadamia integrifolia]